MNLENIYAIVIAAIPALTSILAIIAAIVKCINDTKTTIQPIVDGYEDLKAKVEDTKNIDELKDKIDAVMIENRQLKKEMADLITCIGKVKYEIPKE